MECYNALNGTIEWIFDQVGYWEDPVAVDVDNDDIMEIIVAGVYGDVVCLSGKNGSLLISMLRYISVVIITNGAVALIWTSPVKIPTAALPYSAQNSRYFWLDSAFIGAVYTTLGP